MMAPRRGHVTHVTDTTGDCQSPAPVDPLMLLSVTKQAMLLAQCRNNIRLSALLYTPVHHATVILTQALRI